MSTKKALMVSVLFLMVSGAVHASITLFRSGSAVFKNPTSKRIMSRLLGVSAAELSAMGAKQRGELLAKELDSLNDKKLATDIKSVFRGIYEKRPGVNVKAQLLLARIPNKKVSVRDFMDGGALKALRARAQKGELASGKVEDFASIVRSADKALGFKLLGTGAATCLKTFPVAQVETFMVLVSSLRNPGALADADSAFNAMVSKSQKFFGDNLPKAQKRVCGLAGRGYKCQALASQVCVL